MGPLPDECICEEGFDSLHGLPGLSTTPGVRKGEITSNTAIVSILDIRLRLSSAPTTLNSAINAPNKQSPSLRIIQSPPKVLANTNFMLFLPNLRPKLGSLQVVYTTNNDAEECFLLLAVQDLEIDKAEERPIETSDQTKAPNQPEGTSGSSQSAKIRPKRYFKIGKLGHHSKKHESMLTDHRNVSKYLAFQKVLARRFVV